MKIFILILLIELLCSLGIFIFCSLIEYIRAKLFKIFKIKEILIFIENIIGKIYYKINMKF